ncbi:MAG: hypothetical protein U9O96_04085, partial [Candidatus Thermoplasmatota archaeon]|nr:hypothetical protein [Candidatus Thermoplasmatota archaeon]
GYLWVLEVKKNDNMAGGYHVHYHLIIATDRVGVQTIPEELKLESIWGQRTGVEFVKYSIRKYLSKYLTKENESMLQQRNYGISRVLK